MKTQTILFLGITIFLFSSCQQKLNEKRVRQEITKNLHLPKIADYPIPKEFITDKNQEGLGVTVDLGEEDTRWTIPMINKFEERKLIVLDKTPEREDYSTFFGPAARTWNRVKVSFTDQGKKYLTNENDLEFVVKLWKEDIHQIINIEKSKTVSGLASIAYSIGNTEITPFGECFNNSTDKSYNTVNFFKHGKRWEIGGAHEKRY